MEKELKEKLEELEFESNINSWHSIVIVLLLLYIITNARSILIIIALIVILIIYNRLRELNKDGKAKQYKK